MVKITSQLIKAGSGRGFSYGVRAWTEIEIWCVKGVHVHVYVKSSLK